MDVRHRSPKPSRPSSVDPKKASSKNEDRSPKASDALPLPLYLTNAIFFVLFFSVAYYLLCRWRDKIRSSTPLHVVDLSELLAILSLTASFIYLLGFFGIGFVQSFIARSSSDGWDVVDDDDHHPQRFVIDEDLRCPTPCSAARDTALPSAAIPPSQVVDRLIVTPLSSQEDEGLVKKVLTGKTKIHSLETELGDCYRAALIRREAVQRLAGRSLSGLPVDGFDYKSIKGKCCEMPIGFVQVPLGIAGPLLLDGCEYYIPMATTEGCLVASTNRGCKAIRNSGGAVSIVHKDEMTRAPIVSFATAKRAAELKKFVENPKHFETLAREFEKNSRFAKLKSIKGNLAGKNLYVRFACTTGDAMGMNMVSIGVQQALVFLKKNGFSDMKVVGISGNFCSDKKAAGINWVNGRGKSVVCEATITEDVMKGLKVTVAELVELNMLKNLAGSAIAGAMGGYNAHAANIVSAMFIATGQDPAQNVESSHCITMMEAVNNGKDLHISVTMPCIEVGTVGGGTGLASQSACLNLLGVKGPSETSDGSNAKLLAAIVAGAVLAGELSLMTAIASGELVESHLKNNR